ncbi:hypothetical protein GYH30_029831 [Glycine max]|nr:hypothetical protein GYH30_029831 [Glycine max]
MWISHSPLPPLEVSSPEAKSGKYSGSSLSRLGSRSLPAVKMTEPPCGCSLWQNVNAVLCGEGEARGNVEGGNGGGGGLTKPMELRRRRWRLARSGGTLR